MRPRHARNSARTLFTAGITFAIAAGALILALTATTTRADAAAPIEFGLSVRGDEAPLLKQAEQELGRSVDIVRTFAFWDDQFPTEADLTALDGRDLILSIKPQTDLGRIAWADIANAQPGDQLYEDMVAWANALEPYEDQIWLSFHHEPEAGVNLVHGDAEDFKQAWQTFHTVLADNGFDPLGRVWIATDFSFQVPADDRRHADRWYPGDEWVEAIGTDAYNWFDCRAGITNNWLELEDIIEDFRLFGLAHPDEQLMLAEFGSAEDWTDLTRKAQWLTNAQELFAQPEYDQFTAISYFSLNANNGGFNCDWRFTSSPASQAAFTTFANDPLFGGGIAPPPPPAPPTPPPTTPIEGAVCLATPSGAGFSITWDEPGNPVIRRNGTWLATLAPGATSFVDPTPPPGSIYELRIHTEAGRQDFPCATSTEPLPDPTPDPVDPTPDPVDPTPEPVEPTPAVCIATVDGDTVNLTWDLGGTSIIRRSGAWLANAPEGTLSYTDTNPPVDSTYLIRNRPIDGGVVDHECQLDGEILPPQPTVGCTSTVTADGATLSWDFDGQAIVRKNGNWLTTVSNSQTFTDTTGSAADSYVIRSRVTGATIDHSCG